MCFISLLEISTDRSTSAAMAQDVIHAALMSGRVAQISASIDHPLMHVKLQVQDALQTDPGVLRDSAGRILDERQTLAEAGVLPGDSLALHVRQTRLASSFDSFAAIMGDGSVVRWGHPDDGDSGNVQEQLRNVQHIQATQTACAAIPDHGSVVTWGFPSNGGNCARVQEQLRHSLCFCGHSGPWICGYVGFSGSWW